MITTKIEQYAKNNYYLKPEVINISEKSGMTTASFIAKSLITNRLHYFTVTSYHYKNSSKTYFSYWKSISKKDFDKLVSKED